MKHKITEKITERHVTVHFYVEQMVHKLFDMVNWKYLYSREEEYISAGKENGIKGDLIINIENRKFSRDRDIMFFMYLRGFTVVYYLKNDDTAKRTVISFILPYLSPKARTIILLYLENQE